jgi:hypothetical protein
MRPIRNTERACHQEGVEEGEEEMRATKLQELEVMSARLLATARKLPPGPERSNILAVEGLSEVMRRELKLYGIDVVVVSPATVDTPIWDQPEGAIGRYAATDYGRAFDKGVRTIVRVGHRHGLQAKDVAKTVMKALTARRPRLRYAPARHALMEQALPRLAPKRVTDFVIAHSLGLMPDEKKALRGVSV